MSSIEFNAMLVSNRSVIRGFAFNFTRNADDADDLVQDTLLKALKYREHFSDGTNFRGWLYTIMRNIFLNDCKKHQLGMRLFSRADATNVLVSGQNTGNNTYQMINEKDIQSAISGLRDEIRTPFQMMMDGFLYEEVAAQMKIPVGTVKSRIYNARRRLMNSLKDFN